MNVLDLINKLGSETEKLIGTQLVAPVSNQIVTLVDGVKLYLQPVGNPTGEIGLWTIGKSKSYQAIFNRPANDKEIRNYLLALPKVQCIYLGAGKVHLAHLSDSRFEQNTFDLVNECNQREFSYVECAFNGQMYFIRRLSKNNRLTRTAQTAFNNDTPLSEVNFRNEAMRLAYAEKYIDLEALLEMERLDRIERSKIERRDMIQNAMRHVGATLHNIQYNGSQIHITYSINDDNSRYAGRHITSVLNQDLNMISAGVCLRSNSEIGLTELLSLVSAGQRHGIGDW